ncbi:CPSF A subunit region domain-containing protein [Ditylenchus destructor]|uniref:CPSF A subunit region domain-containing protein n=1 Tax=Ditylenchus destructor TaxID=166010 RepID=A0AAD4NJ12_9BILA|nr:CPSF A subunit region domain-containing protein [Ditylenchus destructor]
MYSILHETDESTAVNLSVYGRFLPGIGKQLAVAGAKCLKFYRINPYSIVPSDDAGKQWTQTTRLECLLTFNLMAPVRSMASCRVPLYPEYDSLVMSFDDAKLSIANVDPKTMKLNTLSLHSIEDDFLRDGYVRDNFVPELRVDPAQRCVAFIVYGRHLGIVPFVHSSKDHHLHSYTIPLRSFDERLDSVLDMTFLDGYYEPTLLFLYEPIKTTSGRACIRYDTIAILGVSLNVKDRVHAVVWNFGGLPMTVDRCLQIPLPVGGICLFGANEIIYLNQSVPPCGVALNSCGDEYTRFPLNDFRHLKITLDGCIVQAEDVNNIFIGLRSGDFYVLTLDIDSANAVKNLRLRKAFETSIPCTITMCSRGYVFVGSRLGDSMFLQYTRESKIADGASKSKKALNVEEKASSKKEALEDEDDFLYSDETPTSAVENNIVEVTHADDEFIFRLLDKLHNVGPCKIVRTCVGQSFNPYAKRNTSDVFDFVTASGHGRDASLCFFERTVRPDVMNTSEIADAVQFWTVGRYENDSQRYLIIAKEVSTLVLELTHEMAELEEAVFITSETTVAAGELAQGSIAIQITAMNIVLVSDNRQLGIYNVNSNFPVIAASIVDPFVALLTQNGKIILYRLMTTSDEAYLKEENISGKLRHEKTPATSICIYKDISGIIQFCSGHGDSEYSVTKTKDIDKKEITSIEQKDDIDALLYGDEGVNDQKPAKRKTQKRKIVDLNEEYEGWAPKLETSVQDPNTILPTYWLCITRENGHFYMYSIPDARLVYMVKKFNQLNETLFDDPSSVYDEDHTQLHLGSYTAQTIEATKPNAEASVIVKPEEIVIELQLYGMGMNQGRPILAALVDDVLVFYEMFFCDDGVEGHLAIRFRRLEYSLVTRSSRFLGPNGRAAVEASRDVERHRPYVQTFERVGKLANGIFICGGYPSFMMLDRGEPRLQPLTVDGQIATFAPFDNENCPNGFLYLTKKDRMMRIALLRSELTYDCSFPVRKVEIRETVHFVVYLMLPNIFGVVTSVRLPNSKYCTVLNEDKQIETCEREENFILPSLEKYKMRTYLAMGTAVNYGEEVFVRGRIILCEIIDVVPEEGMPTSRHRLKTVYDKEQKGPVTAMCSCNGYLLTGMGQKIFIWQFRDGELHGVSFLDMHFYVHHLVGFRNLALACDLYKSLSLIRYQEDFKALSLVSRDLRPAALTPMAAHILVDHKQLGFVLSDEGGNVTLFNYLPETKESMGGERLIVRAVINIGSLINAFTRIKGHSSECLIENEFQVRETQSCVFATLDGSFGVVRPLSEKVFRRLHMLQQVMTIQVPQPAGL